TARIPSRNTLVNGGPPFGQPGTLRVTSTSTPGRPSSRSRSRRSRYRRSRASSTLCRGEVSMLMKLGQEEERGEHVPRGRAAEPLPEEEALERHHVPRAAGVEDAALGQEPA